MAPATSSHGAVFSITYQSTETATTVAESIRREVGEIDGDRSRTRIKRTGPTVEIMVDATDLVALRAGINTWLTLTTVAERTIAIGDAFAASGTDHGDG